MNEGALINGGVSHGQRLFTTMQPTCLQQHWQASKVIRVSVSDPDRFKLIERDPDLEELRSARFPRIKKHPAVLNLKENARLETSRSSVSRRGT